MPNTDNEFSTPKITPNDNVKIPAVNGGTTGYMENDELKTYMTQEVNEAINAINDNFSFVKLVKTAYDATSGEDLITQIRTNEFARYNMVYIGSCSISGSYGCYILFINDSATTAQGLPIYSRGIFWTNSSGYVKFWTANGVYNYAGF